MSASSVAGSCAGGDEAAQGVAGERSLRGRAVRDDEMKIAPVDAQIVAGTVERRAGRAEPTLSMREPGRAQPAPGHGLIGSVDGDDRIDIDQQRDVVRGRARWR